MRSSLRNPNILLLSVTFVVMVIAVTEVLLRTFHVDPVDVAAQRRKAFVENWKPVLPVGTAAPELRLRDRNGVVRTLSEFKGKPVAVGFYSADPRSRIFAREFQKIWKHIGKQHIVSVAVVNFPRKDVPEFVKATGDGSLFLFEESDMPAIHPKYRASPGPNGWVIDRRGNILYGTPPIETDGVPERELDAYYKALRSLIPLEFPKDPRVPEG